MGRPSRRTPVAVPKRPATIPKDTLAVSKKNIGQMLRESGTTGTKNWSGVIQDEYLPALSFYKAPDVYTQMLRSSASIKSLDLAYTMPIRAAKHFIQPFDDSPASLEQADFMHDNLWLFGDQTFDDFLTEALTFLSYGFSWFEKIFDWMDDPKWQGKLGWSRFAFRYQNTRWRWNTPLVPGPGGVLHRKLTSVTQYAPPDYATVDIPVEKLVIFSNDRLGDNYDGISILRAAYKHWYIIDMLYRLQGIGLERMGMGVPYAAWIQKVDDETFKAVQQQLMNLRADDTASITFDKNEVEIGYLDGKFNSQAFQMAIEHHDTKIMQSGLAQFVNLGTRSTGTTGSYALSEDQSQMFLDALNGKANYFCSAFHLQATIQLLEYNFPHAQRSQMPRLQHGDIGERGVQKLALALNAFAQYGFMTPDPRTENFLRQLCDFPERDEDYHEAIAAAVLNTPQHTQPGIIAPHKQTQAPQTQAPQAGNGGSANGQGSQMSRMKGSPKTNMKSLTGTTIGARSLSELAESDRRQYHKAYDGFMDALADMNSVVRSWEPERPSIRAARLRRAYVIRTLAEPTTPTA